MPTRKSPAPPAGQHARQARMAQDCTQLRHGPAASPLPSERRIMRELDVRRKVACPQDRGHARQSKAFRCRRPTRLAAAHVARLGGRDTSIAGARGVEIRPSPRTAINAERPNIGAITLSTQNRRAGADLRRQTRKGDKTRRGNRRHSDGVSGLDRDT